VYRDVRVYYAPADAKRQQLTEAERQQLQRRALQEAGRTATEIAAHLMRRRSAVETTPARQEDELGRGYRRLAEPKAGQRRGR
jgi:IS30 family transposase